MEIIDVNSHLHMLQNFEFLHNCNSLENYAISIV